ncbi:hypothetical protein HPB51_029225 [Rhipicephalus microplus]|uniref:Uncharacterized protein n=1 Tax=Rhipicephalus microplus TaxID=6941 RepID=A0A9J6CVG2_RHIMP|nr:hypothetical protein HPB51_029225 [Rhipicephalus microplus]
MVGCNTAFSRWHLLNTSFLSANEKPEAKNRHREDAADDVAGGVSCHVAVPQRENRIEQLESQYRDLEMEYRRTIERLAVAPRS